MLKIVLALILLAHGIGHSLGLLQLSKVATVKPGWHGDSWILTSTVGALVVDVLVLALVLLSGWVPSDLQA